MATTPDKVRDITGSTLADPEIAPFITTAGILIDDLDCPGISQARLDEAHTYLSAHLLTTSNVGKASAAVKREKLEDVYDVTYAADSGSSGNAMSTEFGRTANMLLGGCLAEEGKRKAGFESIGSFGDASA